MAAKLSPFNIGNLTIDLPVILAPLAGHTDHAYRMICRSMGAPFCSTPMMLDRNLLQNERLRRKLVQLHDGDHPTGAQIVGNRPDAMAVAARKLCEMGVDTVDLNFACPTGKALSRRRGGYLMQHPQTIIAITAAVLAASDRPVTLKLRKSFHSDDGDCETLWELLHGAFELGIAAICVHGRSVEAKYRGRADWQLLSEIKRRFAERTIIGSGDILKPADAVEMLEQTGVDAVIVARGALGNPWFFRQVRDISEGRQPHQPSLAEQREVLLHHLQLAAGIYEPRILPRVLRKCGIKYSRLHPSPRAVRGAFVAIRTQQDWCDVLERYYGAEQTQAGS